jgi:predicted Holliday junction resolvase-like endonuclease
MGQFNGIESFLNDLEAKMIQEEEQLIVWLKRAAQAQQIDDAIRLKEVQWALQECINRINPERKQRIRRQKCINDIFSKEGLGKVE